MQIFKGHSFSKIIKRALFKNALSQWLICALVWAYINLVYYTSRVHIEIHPAAQTIMRGDDNAVFAFWHARLLLMPMICPPKRKMHVMISSHHDGMIIARAMQFFGFGIVAGSSRKGGFNAASSAIDAIRKGDNVSITPDGPKGPALKVQQGTAAVARITGKPVLPICFAARPCKRFRSWDKFVVVPPFARVRFYIGAPVFVTEDTQGMQDVEAAMVAQIAKLEAELGGE